ncbi:MAG: SufE family protein [Hyphomicrobiaceae bacterium]|nr:SufE family protein [Hyphomicrobiaceae bacterium]
MTKFSEIAENLSFLDDWEDRYRYLIELGQQLPPMDEALKTDASKVNGCVSQVWVTSQIDESDAEKRVHFSADSDAAIVKGMVAVLLAFYSDQPAKTIVEKDAVAALDEIGLREHLTAQRTNGLISMVRRMQAEAQRALQ